MLIDAKICTVYLQLLINFSSTKSIYVGFMVGMRHQCGIMRIFKFSTESKLVIHDAEAMLLCDANAMLLTSDSSPSGNASDVASYSLC